MATFGGRGKRPGGRASGPQGDIFIKTFPKDADRILVWILDKNPPKLDNGECGWYNIEQHFDPAAKRSWPCAIAEGAERCVGEDFPVGDPTNENDRGLAIHNTSSAYILPIVDEKGYVSLFQFGWGLYEDLCGKYEEYGTLNGSWYAIRRTKQGGRTSYSATKTDNKDAPEIKIGVPDDAYIAQAVGARYLEAMERYGYDPETGGFGDADNATDPPRESKPKKQAVADPPADEGQQPAPDTTSDQPAADEPVGEWDLHLNAREASVGELKDWLANIPEKFGGPRESPARPQRGVIVSLVEKAQAEFDQPPF